jgi:hypothetical protein
MLGLFSGKKKSTRIPTEERNESVVYLFLKQFIGVLAPLIKNKEYFTNEEMREIFDIIKVPVIDLAIYFFLKISNQKPTKVLLNNISNIIKNSNILKIFYDNKILEKAKLRKIYGNYYFLKKEMELLLKEEIDKVLLQDNPIQQNMYHSNPLRKSILLKQEMQKVHTDLKIKQEMQKVKKKVGELKDLNKIVNTRKHQFHNPVLPAILQKKEMRRIQETDKRNRAKIEVFHQIPSVLENFEKNLNYSSTIINRDKIEGFNPIQLELENLKKNLNDETTILLAVLYLLKVCSGKLEDSYLKRKMGL